MCVCVCVVVVVVVVEEVQEEGEKGTWRSPPPIQTNPDGRAHAAVVDVG